MLRFGNIIAAKTTVELLVKLPPPSPDVRSAQQLFVDSFRKYFHQFEYILVGVNEMQINLYCGV